LQVGILQAVIEKKDKRCFVALDLPEALRAEAQCVQDQLREQSTFQGRFTAPENLHLTLKFLGEIHDDAMEDAAAALRNIQYERPTLRLTTAGMFAPRIVWVAVAGADELQQAVDTALENQFPPEARFMGHLTIARVKSAPDPRALKRAVKTLKVEPVEAASLSFSLMESRLRSEGPKYTAIEQFPLGPPTGRSPADG